MLLLYIYFILYMCFLFIFLAKPCDSFFIVFLVLFQLSFSSIYIDYIFFFSPFIFVLHWVQIQKFEQITEKIVFGFLCVCFLLNRISIIFLLTISFHFITKIYICMYVKSSLFYIKKLQTQNYINTKKEYVYNYNKNTLLCFVDIIIIIIYLINKQLSFFGNKKN